MKIWAFVFSLWLLCVCVCVSFGLIFSLSLSANRVVEVNEMWQARQKELELDDRCRGRLRDGSSSDSSHRDNNASTNKKPPKSTNNTSASCSSSERVYETGYSMEDEELEEFLHSRS